MADLKVKYWAGFINSETINRVEFIDLWLLKVEQAKKQDQELIVFKIPIGTNTRNGNAIYTQTINEIESFLQEKFGK